VPLNRTITPGIFSPLLLLTLPRTSYCEKRKVDLTTRKRKIRILHIVVVYYVTTDEQGPANPKKSAYHSSLRRHYPDQVRRAQGAKGYYLSPNGHPLKTMQIKRKSTTNKNGNEFKFIAVSKLVNAKSSFSQNVWQ
jgi:hypothetical protein